MDPRRLFAALALVVPSLSAFGAPPELPPAAGKSDVTYATDIRPIFETSCVKCHGAQRHRGGLRLDSREAALAGGEDGKVIVPGDSAKSPLVLAVAQVDPDTSMPPPRKNGPPTKLSQEQIGLLRAWIDQGAK